MPTQLSKNEIKEGIFRLAPFYHDVELPYGLRTSLPQTLAKQKEDTRVRELVNHAFPALLEVFGGSLAGKRVLDAACNCGGFSIQAVKAGAESVLGFDVVERYIEQANFIKQSLGIEHVDFQAMEIDELRVSDLGMFDITLCFGILYHLENPMLSMKRLASLTSRAMLVETAVERPIFEKPPFSFFLDPKPIWVMNSPKVASEESNIATSCLWRLNERVVQFRPNETAVIEMLKSLGFDEVRKIKEQSSNSSKRFYTTPRVTFIALRN